MGIRALGETDATAGSGIGKLCQILFPLLASKNNPDAVVISLLVGTILESEANQASDVKRDFEIAHFLQTSPKSQFYGQIIGNISGVIVTPLVSLYVAVYDRPSQLLQMPGAYIWILRSDL